MAFDRRETALLVIGDFLILVASLWVALVLRNLSLPSFGYFEANIGPFLPLLLLSLVVFYVSGLYEKQTRLIRRVMWIRILGAQIANIGIAALTFFLLPLTIAPKTILVLYLIVSVITESLWRFYRIGREIKTASRTPALLLGSGEAVQELFEEINSGKNYTIRFMRHLEKASPEQIGEAVSAGAHIVVADAQNLSVLADASGVTVLEFNSFYESIFDRVPLSHIDASELLGSLSERRFVYDSIKRLFDFVLGLVAAVIALPFIAFAVCGRALTGTPVFFLHTRIGKGGKPFILVKLGSMLLNDHGDPELQKKNRVTRFGKFLRKTRIDELPQLWNILRGDLSFIGPRPELPKIAEVYEREIPYYHLRHMIAPGLSGWAQIHDYDAPRGGADVSRTRRKLSFDLYYLKYRSVGLDLAITLKTLRALLSLSGT